MGEHNVFFLAGGAGSCPGCSLSGGPKGLFKRIYMSI